MLLALLLLKSLPSLTVMSPRPVHRSLTLVQVYPLQMRLIVMVTQLVRCLFHIAHSCLLTLLLEYLPQGPQFPSLGATPWDFPSRPPGALLPWWQSSNVSHGNQNVQQFVNSPVPVPPHRPVSHTFRVRFIEGNVSVCYGCWNKYPKKAEPPDNICLQTEEWREFTPPGALAPQTCWSNTYYLRVRCVQLNGLTLTLTLRWSLMMTFRAA